ncbi:MAG: hypothetical protein ABSF50_03930 [Burkholderiaceae bacterium]
MRRALLWSTGLVLGFALLSGLVLFLVNWADEDLSPMARALLSQAAPVAPVEQNLYLALLGRAAPKGQSPVEFGRSRLARYEKSIHAPDDPSSASDVLDDDETQGLSFQGQFEKPQFKANAVWSGITGRESEIRTLLDQNRELYDRYLGLHQFAQYAETATPSPFTPLVSAGRDIRILFLASVALRMKGGDPAQRQAAMNELENDLRTWHTVMVSTHTLIPKLVAAAYFQSDQFLIADMLADKTLVLAGLLPQLDRMTSLCALTDWNLSSVFFAEFRGEVPYFDAMQSRPLAARELLFYLEAGNKKVGFVPTDSVWEPVARHFYKKNATENLDASDIDAAIALSSTSPSELMVARQRYLAWRTQNMDFLNLGLAYNPLGKIMLAEHVLYSRDNYILRGYDSAALQRLVRLAFELRRQRIPAAQVAPFMRTHPEWATHPVDGNAFVWDSANSSVSLRPLAIQASDARLAITVCGADCPAL